MSKWREATAEETEAFHSGYQDGTKGLYFRETEHGVECIDSAVYNSAEDHADIAYGQALWYAWGRIDSGVYSQEVKERLDAFEYARIVKGIALAFLLEETVSQESIQGQWSKYVESKTR